MKNISEVNSCISSVLGIIWEIRLLSGVLYILVMVIVKFVLELIFLWVNFGMILIRVVFLIEVSEILIVF